MNRAKSKKDLPDSWTEVRVGDLCLRIHYGYTASTTDIDTGVRFLRITDISDDGVNWKNVPFCAIDEAEIEKYELAENDLVFARTGGTVGKSYLIRNDVPPKSVFASYLIRLQASKNINPKLLGYFFQSRDYWEYIDMNKTGLKTNVNAQILSNIPISVPPLNEQNRIVQKLDELLSELEKGKEQLQTSLEQLKVYRQSILKSAFEGKLSEEWRSKQKKLKTPEELVAEIKAYRRLQYEKQLKEYKAGKIKIKPKEPKEILLPSQSELANKPELPKGWAYFFLRDISDAVERVVLKEKKASESFFYLDIGGINNNKNVIESHKEYKWKDAPSRAQQVVKLYDILFSTVRTYMKNIAMVEDVKFINQVASSGFTVIRALEGIINPKFLFKQLLSDTFIQPLNELQTGSSYPAVRDTDVFNQIVPICSFEEQSIVTEELDEKYSVIQNLEETIHQNLIQSDSLRQTLLQKAFAGNLVEQDSNDEPASVLLERIKKEREEFLKAEKERKKSEKPFQKKSRKMAEELKRILEILKESKEPVSAKTLWQASLYKDDIDDFYAALKKHIEAGEVIELPRKGKESFLKLADAK